MTSRPYCYRCEEFTTLGGCGCKNPAFSIKDLTEEEKRDKMEKIKKEEELCQTIKRI